MDPNCYIGEYSLLDQCYNEMTKSFMSAPCQPIVCDMEDVGEEAFPQWAWPLIVVGGILLAVLGFLTFFYLKKKCDHTLTVVVGFVLAATLKPPMPQSKDEDVEAANENMEVEQPSAPPSYNEAISATQN